MMHRHPRLAQISLALSGVAYAALAFLYFVYLPAGVRSSQGAAFLGTALLAAGIFLLAACALSPTIRQFGLLPANAFTTIAFGVVLTLRVGSVAFRTLAALDTIMVLSLCAYALLAAFKPGRSPAAKGLSLACAGVGLMFAAQFLGFSARWIKLSPSPSAQTFYWLGAYFAFSALCMAMLIFDLRWLHPSESRPQRIMPIPGHAA